MPRAEFEQLNRGLEEAGEATFANPRNAAAGAVRQKDPAVTARRPLDMFLYHVSWSPGLAFTSHWEALEALRAAGFHTNPRADARRDDRRGDRVLRRAGDGARRARLRRRRRGGEGRHARAAAPAGLDRRIIRAGPMAFKFAARQATTVVQAIEVNVGKTGTLTPVAKLAPVPLAGVVISNVSLHNEDELRRKDVRVGDTVLIERAGDVIPYVVQVVASKRPPEAVALQLPRALPGVRRRRVPPGGRGLLALHEHGLSGPAQGASAPLRLAARHGHRAPGRGGGRAARRPRPGEGLRRSLPAHRPAARRARAPGREVGAEPRRRHRGLASDAAWPACSTRSASASWASAWPACWPRASDPSSA